MRTSVAFSNRLRGIGAVVGSLVVPLALIVAAIEDVHARMYQWVSPQSGRPQLSGTPPTWYRSDAGGPRVRVYDDGNLVDDTAIALPRAQAQELREAAFEEHEQRQRAEALRQLERTALREQRREEEAARLAEQQAREREERQAAAGASGGTDASPVPATPEELTPEAIERLKALLTEFDRRGGGLGN